MFRGKICSNICFLCYNIKQFLHLLWCTEITHNFGRKFEYFLCLFLILLKLMILIFFREKIIVSLVFYFLLTWHNKYSIQMLWWTLQIFSCKRTLKWKQTIPVQFVANIFLALIIIYDVFWQLYHRFYLSAKTKTFLTRKNQPSSFNDVQREFKISQSYQSMSVREGVKKPTFAYTKVPTLPLLRTF